MKIYKHKKTREEAKRITEHQSYFNINGEIIHRRFIEDSLDWEEVLKLDYEILKSCPIEGAIYSVKRLSDNQVFTLGDNSNYGEVKGFEVQNKGMVVQYFKIGDWQWLNSIEKTVEKTIPKTYTEEEMMRAIKHWGFCQVDIQYLNEFLNKK